MGDIFDTVQPDKPLARAGKGDIFDQVAAPKPSVPLLSAAIGDMAAQQQKKGLFQFTAESLMDKPLLQQVDEAYAFQPDDSLLTQGGKALAKVVLAVPSMALGAVDSLTRQVGENAPAEDDSVLTKLGKIVKNTPPVLIGKTIKQLAIDPQTEQIAKGAAEYGQAIHEFQSAREQGKTLIEAEQAAKPYADSAATRMHLGVMPLAGPMIAHTADEIERTGHYLGPSLELAGNAALLGLAGPENAEGVREPAVRTRGVSDSVSAPPETAPTSVSAPAPDVFDLAAERAASVARQQAREAAVIDNAKKLMSPESSSALTPEEHSALEQSGLTVDHQGRLARVVKPVDDARVSAIKNFVDANLNAATESGQPFDKAQVEKRAAAMSTDELVGAVGEPARSGEAGFIKAGALIPELPSFKSEPPAVTENLSAIRKVQTKKFIEKTPDLPPIEKVLESVPEYAKKVSRTMYDRFRDWRQVSRELQKRGVELSADENPDHVLDMVYGGTGGKLQAEAIEMKAGGR